MAHRTLTILLAAAALTPALAEAHAPQARLRNLEATVMVEREDGWTEEASLNLPVMPGDRLRTGLTGRLELQFADGSLLRLDRAGQLDYAALPDDPADASEPVRLRLWAGSAYLHTAQWPRVERYEIDTPHGRVEIERAGLFRIDTGRTGTQLSVLAGKAVLAVGQRRASVQAGKASYCRQGFSPQDPRVLQRPEDEFDRWNAGLPGPLVGPMRDTGFLPELLAPFSGELEGFGAWDLDPRLGRPVWRPFVSQTWEPYTLGRWYWTAAGWSWVSEEPWGWVPYHFGHWDLSDALGWFWVPEDVWGPAWVSWIVDEDYVGWCWCAPDDLDPYELRSTRRHCFFTHHDRFHTRDVHHQRVELGRDRRERMGPAHSRGSAPLDRDLHTIPTHAKAEPRSKSGSTSGAEKRHPSPGGTGQPPGRKTEPPQNPVPAPDNGSWETSKVRPPDPNTKPRPDEGEWQAKKGAAEEWQAEKERAAERRAAEQKAAEEQRREEERRQAEQKAAEWRAAEQRAAEQRRAEEQRAAEQKAAEWRAAEQRTAEQRRAAEQRAAEQKAAEWRAAEQRAAEQRRAEEQRAAEQKAAEWRAAEEQRREEERRQAEQKAAEQQRVEEQPASEWRAKE